ncbi:unnamed protein product [Brachionus calyciflorus]|uniref:EGF-like domain-containing protein n=1 Tax=Brachionus calyciflorus TaxID=104777 RepID=A0A813ZAE2_9BILA|nr:unnamed protein product [Brachionus calyciflorus]
MFFVGRRYFIVTNIEIDINKCLSKRCSKNATCIDPINSYECKCPPGYTRDSCEINFNKCESSQCNIEVGKCIDLIKDDKIENYNKNNTKKKTRTKMSFLGKTLGKIVNGSQTKSTNSIQNEPFQKINFSHDTQLTLTHLRKVFYESSPKDDKLYQILPLFFKAFSQSSLSDINDKFGDFCFACSRLLVNEISKRVHDDLVLVKFFDIKTSDDATDGAGLLSTVNLLASGPPFLIEIMTKCLLPTRLVMCVCLFISNRESSESHIKHPDRKAQMTSSTVIKRSNSFLKNLTNLIDEPFIIHPGAVSSILNLLPSVTTSSHQMAYRLQYNMINLIKKLLKFERYQ